VIFGFKNKFWWNCRVVEKVWFAGNFHRLLKL
jgi:hypothetical protein